MSTEERGVILGIAKALENVEVHGKQNLGILASCIDALEQLAAIQNEPQKEAE